MRNQIHGISFDSVKKNNKFKLGIEFNFPIIVKEQENAFFMTSIGVRLISLKKANTFQIIYYQLNEPASIKVKPFKFIYRFKYIFYKFFL